MRKWHKEISNYYQKMKNYYLGMQLGFDSECHMFIDFENSNDTGRGNIEIFDDGTIHWFFTYETNTENQRFVEKFEQTPEWFKKIYYHTMALKETYNEDSKTA